MRVVVASDSFKGSLSSRAIIDIVAAVANEALPDAEIVGIQMADGGEGTVSALIGEDEECLRRTRVTGPLGAVTVASWGLLAGGVAVIEMAAASGLPLVPLEARNPLHTSTFGTGELITAALDAGASSVMLAIGGSATNDGGMGALAALGATFRDDDGTKLVGSGRELSRVRSADFGAVDRRLRTASITVMCDVDNPLLGPEGASAVFAPQKGASEDDVAVLEAGMAQYAQAVCTAMGVDHDVAVAAPGAGAAGGLGFALMTVLGATMVPGVEAVLDAAGFDDALAGADLVVTGEGRLDTQTERGKVISGVARRCRRAGVPCVAIVGSVASDVHDGLGLSGVYATTPVGMSLDEAMSRASELYAQAVRRVFEPLGS